MKKVLIYLMILSMPFVLTACKDDEKKRENYKWPEKTYFDQLPVPSNKIDKIIPDKKNDTQIEYSVYVNEYKYEEFYEYITELEKIGFNYEFYKNSVPSSLNDLNDKTETSWGANNGKIWIRALWRSNDNAYYNGYNLQLIFNNYDYLKPITK